MARFGFNASEHEIPQFESLPPGWYLATITSSELVASKSESAGEMFQLTFEVDANEHPEFAHRKVTTNLCINHQSEKTAHIARGQLAKILMVTNTPTITDTVDLLGKSLRIRLGMGKASPGYEARSEYKDCRAASAPDSTPAPQPAKTSAAPAPAQPAAAKPVNGTKAAKPAWK